MSIPVQYTNERTIEGNAPIVILGPNGSGKTRYGNQLAQWNNADVVAALRNIALEENLPLQSLNQAEQELANHRRARQLRPWNISSEINNLFAKLMAEDSAAATAFRDQFQAGTATEPETTKLMQLSGAWERLFPGRHISFGGHSPKVTSEYVAGENAYPAQQMSDGERVALYLAARVLDASPGVILVDEPEVHFHSRLAVQFWNELEEMRSDCRFVYITHDLVFARSRQTSAFLIVRPGQEPDLVDVTEGIPEDICEAILSAASFSIYATTIIFCEGSESSYDQKFLRSYFNRRDVAVIPVGSCKDVVRCAVSFHNNGILSGVTSYGYVDSDYWPDVYLEALQDPITTLPVHEVESLFCMRSIFELLARHHGKPPGEINADYLEFLQQARARFEGGVFWKQVSERFRYRCEGQIQQAFSNASIEGDDDAIRRSHEDALRLDNWNTPPDQIFEQETALLRAALEDEDQFLRYFPGKVYLSLLADQLGMTKQAYVDLICNSLLAGEGDELIGLGQAIRGVLDPLLENA